MTKKITFVFLAICSLFILGSCAKKEVLEPDSVVQIGEDDDAVDDSDAIGGKQFSTPEPEKSSITEKFEDAKKVNSDVVGWITVPNTGIDYPIVMTNNNDYYINHDLEKKESKSGALFLDYRNADKSLRKHMIVYGHNMKNGTMFRDLNNFKNKDFFENNETFSILLFGEEHTYKVVSEFIVSSDIDFIRTNFTSDNDFIEFMNELQFLRKFESDYKPSADDEIITLSTCSYEYNNMRNVVQGLRIS